MIVRAPTFESRIVNPQTDKRGFSDEAATPEASSLKFLLLWLLDSRIRRGVVLQSTQHSDGHVESRAHMNGFDNLPTGLGRLPAPPSNLSSDSEPSLETGLCTTT